MRPTAANRDPGSYWSEPPARLLEQLRSTASGLDAAEASARLARHGPNSLPRVAGTGALRLYAGQFRSPLVLMRYTQALITQMTQELIANMLGVRREGVTEAAGSLQTAGLVRYRRGHITVLDRPGLEARSCECYRVVRTEYERLLPRRVAE